MLAAKLLVIFAYAVISISGNTSCLSQKHYEELKCTGIKEKPDDPCPSRYECPDFTALDRTKCHLNKKAYTVGEKISTALPTCTSSCSCDGADDEFGFSCKFDECPESKEPPKPECAYQYSIDSCCSIKTICDKAEIDNLPRCWSDGHEFVKGNLIYSPTAPCHKCLCDDKFDNTTEIAKNPSCKPVDCGIELHQLSYLQLGCIPVYFNDGLCCPFEFRCPNDSDAVEAGKGAASPNTCKYGKLTLNVGDKIKTSDPCLECTCATPPLAQCTRIINTEQCH